MEFRGTTKRGRFGVWPSGHGGSGPDDCVAPWVSALLDFGHYSHAGRGSRHQSARSDEVGLVNGGVCVLKQDRIPKC